MKISVNNKENVITIDLKDNIIISNKLSFIELTEQHWTDKTSKLNFTNGHFINIKYDSKIKTIIEIIKFVYRKDTQ